MGLGIGLESGKGRLVVNAMEFADLLDMGGDTNHDCIRLGTNC